MQSVEFHYRIPFHDVDPMNIVWHGHYVRYIELARCKLLETIDYTYSKMFDSGYAWPVVDMRIKYIKPILYDQEIVIVTTIKEYEFRLKLAYEIRDAKSGEKLTTAHTIQVAVDMQTEEMCFQSPEILLEKLGVESDETSTH